MKEYGIEDGDKVEKYHIALLFNKGTAEVPDYIQLSKATENTITVNAETEDRDFITDQNPTTLIKKYKPSLSNPLTMFKGEEDYEYFFEKFYNLPTGKDAEGEILVVFMNAPESTEHTFKAWKCGCTFVFDNIDPANSTMTWTTQFNGTIEKGTATVTAGKVTFA